MSSTTTTTTLTSSSSSEDNEYAALERLHPTSGDVEDSVTEEERRAQEHHQQRLARIVADHWMYVTRLGLMLSYCSKIVHYWRKLSQQRNRSRKQSSLAVEHFTRNIFRRVFNALHEARQMMSTTSDAVAKLHDSSLKKKALKGLSDPDKIYREHHHKHSLARVFRVLQHNLDGYGSSDVMDNTVVKLYGTSLKKQALHRLASHLAYRRSKVAKEKLSLAHWRRSTEGKVLRNWVLFSRDHASKIRQQEQLHEIQLRKLLIASLKAWYQHTRDLREEGRYKSGQAAELWNRLSNLQTGQVWKAWIAIQKEKNMRALKKTQASNMHRGVKTAAATSAWRNYVMEKEIERGRLSEAQSYWKQQALKSAMQTWQIYLEAQRAKHDALLRASEHLKRVLKQKSMNSWKPWYKRQITKEINLQHAANMYRDRLHRWGCERILAVGFMLQALRLQSRLERQPRLSASTLAKVAPYARKWWYLTQQRKKPRKESPKLQDNLTLNNAVKVGVASLLTQDRITHEVLLRIGLVNEGSQMPIQRPAVQLVDDEPAERAQPRGRLMIPAPPTAGQPLSMSRPGVRSRPQPRRPAFLSQNPLAGSSVPSIPTTEL
ncbi:hypothetical protein BDL97_10G066400 [Sphagnum fallax]|nr:hypothetical protein BDL97_10G066400 [Sphagnum fallax]